MRKRRKRTTTRENNPSLGHAAASARPYEAPAGRHVFLLNFSMELSTKKRKREKIRGERKGAGKRAG
jgi:hypothetical protein